MKFLPVGIQNFEQMITGNFLYVDKTRHIHEMVRPPQGFYFLARPRRFGKSLTVSVLENFFKGRKELFSGLWIGQKDWEWKPHPVITIDFSAMGIDTPEILEKDLLLHVRNLAGKDRIELPDASLPYQFSTLIVQMAEKYNEKVVVLIDEYDKPIIEHLGKGEEHLEIAKANRDKLKPFFGVLKSGDVSAALRFVFITGISKFARVSIFSDLNNLDDISMQEVYDTVVGYTEEELRNCFGDYIEKIIEKKKITADSLVSEMRDWYDGYRFTESETRVYNPFSVIKFLKAGKFGNYWFETATPSFLMNLIRERNYPVVDIEGLRLPKELISVYDIDRLTLEPLLLQTGYLTIRHFDEIFYHIGYPNQEVKVSFLAYLLNDMIRSEDIRMAGVYKLLHVYLRDKKIEEFVRTVQGIIAAIPYTLIANRDESYYHSLFYLMLSASGVNAHTEVLTSRGRMDMAAEFSDKVYVIELKCNHNSDKAIQQILDKKYYEKYLQSGKTVYLMGINFDSEKRAIADWRWGELNQLIKGKDPAKARIVME